MPSPPDITVTIPAHPARLTNGMLQRALDSVWSQTTPPAAVSVAVDWHKQGAPATRQRALNGVTTDLVAFIDSDDWFDQEHLELLYGHMCETGADFVFSYFHGSDFLGCFGRVFDPIQPHETTSTVLVRTQLAVEVGFRPLAGRTENTGEDFGFVLGCVAAGAKIVHLPRRTWTYSMGPHNSSGLPGRGDA